MPRINLLPVREAKRAESARHELAAVTAMLLLFAVGLVVWHHSVADDIADLQAKIVDITAQTEAVQKKVFEVDEFKKKTATLERKIDIIDQLKRKKIGPAKMMADLADIATKQRKVWLTSFEDTEGAVKMQGGAMEQENVSELQLSLEQQSSFFKDITLTLVNAAKQGGMTFYEWTILCTANYAAG